MCTTLTTLPIFVMLFHGMFHLLPNVCHILSKKKKRQTFKFYDYPENIIKSPRYYLEDLGNFEVIVSIWNYASQVISCKRELFIILTNSEGCLKDNLSILEKSPATIMVCGKCFLYRDGGLNQPRNWIEDTWQDPHAMSTQPLYG